MIRPTRQTGDTRDTRQTLTGASGADQPPSAPQPRSGVPVAQRKPGRRVGEAPHASVVLGYTPGLVLGMIGAEVEPWFAANRAACIEPHVPRTPVPQRWQVAVQASAGDRAEADDHLAAALLAVRSQDIAAPDLGVNRAAVGVCDPPSRTPLLYAGRADHRRAAVLAGWRDPMPVTHRRLPR